MRVIALASLALLLWRVVQPARTPDAAVTAGGDLSDALRRWTLTSFPNSVHAAFPALPTRAQRDWLKAAAGLGTAVSWSGAGDAPAIELNATAEPVASYVIRAASVVSGPQQMRDALRGITTVPEGSGTTVVRTAVVADQVMMGEAGRGPVAQVAPAPVVKRVALIGPAGWETKFVAAALEESGWQVDARLFVAPAVDVGGLSAAALDTLRYSALVAVDAIPDQWVAPILRFVASGGGLVLSGTAVNNRPLSQVLPARASTTLEGRDTSVVGLAALAGRAIDPAAEAVVMESRGDTPVVVGRRAGAGRVIAVGYADTWRWRMQGAENSSVEHRLWWSSIVAAAAYATDTALVSAPESAPRAALVAALGAPVTTPGSVPHGRFPFDAALFALASIALLAEIVLRRRRGLR